MIDSPFPEPLFMLSGELHPWIKWQNVTTRPDSYKIIRSLSREDEKELIRRIDVVAEETAKIGFPLLFYATVPHLPLLIFVDAPGKTMSIMTLEEASKFYAGLAREEDTDPQLT